MPHHKHYRRQVKPSGPITGSFLHVMMSRYSHSASSSCHVHDGKDEFACKVNFVCQGEGPRCSSWLSLETHKLRFQKGMDFVFHPFTCIVQYKRLASGRQQFVPATFCLATASTQPGGSDVHLVAQGPQSMIYQRRTLLESALLSSE